MSWAVEGVADVVQVVSMSWAVEGVVDVVQVILLELRL